MEADGASCCGTRSGCKGWKLDKPVGWFRPLPVAWGSVSDAGNRQSIKKPLRGNEVTCDRIPEGFTLPENIPTSCIFIHVQVNFPLLILGVLL